MRNARVLNLGLVDLDGVILEVKVDLDLSNAELFVILGDVDVFLEVPGEVQDFSVEGNPGRCGLTLSHWENRVEFLFLTGKRFSPDAGFELTDSHWHIIARVKVVALQTPQC